MHAGIQSLGTPHPPDRGMVRVTRPGDPVTVGLTRLGQARVLEERPTLTSRLYTLTLPVWGSSLLQKVQSYRREENACLTGGC